MFAPQSVRSGIEMNMNTLTIKSQEALQNAQEIASSYNNQAIEPEHLLAALVQDPEGKEELDAEDIAEIVSRWTGIPVSRMLESERTKLLHLEERLHERIVNQVEAVHVVSDAIRRARAGLQDEKRPIGSFIFMGSTGVGKTELARALIESDAASDDPA